MKIKTSEPFSFKGYSFVTWLRRNKETLKNILMIISGISTYAITNYLPTWATLGLAGLVAALVKLGVDAIDYYTTETFYTQ